MESVLVPWVREGGHLVVLPQFELRWSSSLRRSGFQRLACAFAPESAVRTDSTSQLLKSPNGIGADDWKGWVVARALGSVRLPAREGVSMPVTTEDDGAPLVAEITEGKGRITIVALDLVSQLMNVHPGSLPSSRESYRGEMSLHASPLR